MKGDAKYRKGDPFYKKINHVKPSNKCETYNICVRQTATAYR